MDKSEYQRLGAIILDAAITVHRILGPGLLESAYKLALVRELQLRNIHCRMNVPVELFYKGKNLKKAYNIDILVENEIVVETKATDQIHPIFISQLITYLKLNNKKLGYLINFNVSLLKDGFKRIVYNY